MFKRIRWMSLGAAVGLGGSVWARRQARRTLERYLPAQMGSHASQRARDLRDDLLGALDEGRVAMRDREAELRGQLGVDPAPLPRPALTVVPSPDQALPHRTPPIINVAEGRRAGTPEPVLRRLPGPRRRRRGD